MRVWTFLRRLAAVARAPRQVAALPMRRTAAGDTEVLLVTTRGRGSWTIPKGWPMRGRSDAEAAAQEAREEAGVIGTVGPNPVGTFRYCKRGRGGGRAIRVTVYRLDVSRTRRRWRERDERKLRWLPPEVAAEAVAWPDLGRIILAAADMPRPSHRSAPLARTVRCRTVPNEP